MEFHYYVYGPSDQISSMATFKFGIINCMLVYVFRNGIISDFLHFTNNFAITYFSMASVSLMFFFSDIIFPLLAVFGLCAILYMGDN